MICMLKMVIVHVVQEILVKAKLVPQIISKQDLGVKKYKMVTKVNSKIACFMERAFIHGKEGKEDMKVNEKMVIFMERVNSIGKMAKHLMEPISLVKNMDWELLHEQMVGNIQVTLKMEYNMDKENIQMLKKKQKLEHGHIVEM